jgi:hypothetical protein
MRMSVIQIIAQLREERAALDEAIAVLERLARSDQLRRGGPPGQLSEAAESASKRVFSAATRKKMAEGQRKRWEAYRKAKEQG